MSSTQGCKLRTPYYCEVFMDMFHVEHASRQAAEVPLGTVIFGRSLRPEYMSFVLP
jgi:hypothetical protein